MSTNHIAVDGFYAKIDEDLCASMGHEALDAYRAVVSDGSSVSLQDLAFDPDDPGVAPLAKAISSFFEDKSEIVVVGDDDDLESAEYVERGEVYVWLHRDVMRDCVESKFAKGLRERGVDMTEDKYCVYG